MGTTGSIRKFYILEAYMMDEGLAYKVKVDEIGGDFIELSVF